jgi:small conductance mechanosensitive channel
MPIDQKYIDLAISYGQNAVVAVLIFIGGWWIGQWVSSVIKNRVIAFGRGDETLASVLAKVSRIAIMVLTIIIVLSQFGVQTASLVALLGAAGLAIGLALQGALSNVAAGVMLLVLRPFKLGDAVDVDGISGSVKDMGLFMTQINTPDNIAVMVPNNRIWGAPIRNFARNDTRRLDLVFSIAYEDDIDQAINIIKAVVNADNRALKNPEPLYTVGQLGENSVDLFVRPWVKQEEYWNLRFALIKEIKQELEKGGITIPFPQRIVHVQSASGIASS